MDSIDKQFPSPEYIALYEALWMKIKELENLPESPKKIRDFSEVLFKFRKDKNWFAYWLQEGTNSWDSRYFFRRYDEARRKDVIILDKLVLYNILVYLGYSLSNEDKLTREVADDKRKKFQKHALKVVDTLKEKFLKDIDYKSTERTVPDSKIKFEADHLHSNTSNGMKNRFEGTKWYLYSTDSEQIKLKNGAVKSIPGITRSILTLLPSQKIQLDGYSAWEGGYIRFLGSYRFIKDDMALLIEMNEKCTTDPTNSTIFKKYRETFFRIFIYVGHQEPKVAIGKFDDYDYTMYGGAVMIEPIPEETKEKKVKKENKEKYKILFVKRNDTTNRHLIPKYARKFFNKGNEAILSIPPGVINESSLVQAMEQPYTHFK